MYGGFCFLFFFVPIAVLSKQPNRVTAFNTLGIQPVAIHWLILRAGMVITDLRGKSRQFCCYAGEPAACSTAFAGSHITMRACSVSGSKCTGINRQAPKLAKLLTASKQWVNTKTPASFASFFRVGQARLLSSLNSDSDSYYHLFFKENLLLHPCTT